MELILEALWLLVQLLVELFLGAAEVGVLDALDAPPRFWTFAGWFAGGLALGLLSGWLLPARLLPVPATGGISLLLSPLVSGTAMYFWGDYRRSNGRPANSLATWWGGAAFAFGCALGRFVLIA